MIAFRLQLHKCSGADALSYSYFESLALVGVHPNPARFWTQRPREGQTEGKLPQTKGNAGD